MYRLIEHTADMGIEAKAPTCEELFIEAALGLKLMIFGAVAGTDRETRQVHIEGDDAEELMVDWLNEVLYLFEIHHFFPERFSIETVGDGALKGAVHGELFSPGHHPVQREVKAITFHQLKVQRVAEGWWVRIYVDL